eukprot:g4350.t1
MPGEASQFSQELRISGDIGDRLSFVSGLFYMESEYSLTGDSAMIYGGLSRGFRSGGFNGRGASPTAIGPYDEETVNSFEGGLRAEFFDNRLRFNPTFFIAEYDDKQEESATGAGDVGAVETTVQNAASVDIQGMELEVLAQVTSSLTFRGSVGLLDAEFAEFLVPEDPADPTNTNFVDVSDSRNLRSGPDANLSLGATYVQSVMDGNGQLTFNLGYNWTDEMITSAASDTSGLDRDRIGELVQSEEIDVKAATMMHDFIITRHYVIFMDLPMLWDLPNLLKPGVPVKFDESYELTYESLGIDYKRLLHAEEKFDYLQPIHAGDRLSLTAEVVDVYEKKGGALQFIVIVTSLHRDGNLVQKITGTLVMRQETS